MSNLSVLISGSGIAGSAFAFCLLRAYPNANITIVERDPKPRLTGASVDIRSNAVDIIKWMGIEQKIRDATTKEEGVQFVDANDKPIATFNATGRTDIQSMTSEFEIFRGSLAQILFDPVRERVNLVFDETVESYEQRDGGVFVTFTRSKETKKYNLLVAADGMGSKIRGTMLNSKPREQVMAKQGAHASYFTISGDLLNGNKLAKWYNSTKGRAVFIRPDPDPRGRTRANLINVTASGDAGTRERLDEAMHAGNESYMQVLEEMFQDVGWLTPDILKGMRESDDFYCSVFAQVRSPKFVDGRVVLMGDAGYATPGFGTSLAIIGGYVLAGELLNASGDVETAAKRYEDLFLPFVKSSQGGMSNAMQYLNPQTEWGVYIRDCLLGFVTWSRLDKLAMSVASTVGFSEKKLAMPDYQWPA